MMNNHRVRGRGRGNRRGGGQRGEKRAGDRTKGVFFKLLKDGDAKMRSKLDAGRFVQGMVSFSSKAEMLGHLDDNRYFGSKRLGEALAFIEDEHEVNEILVPIISCITDEEISRPLYKKARIRIIAAMNNVPGLMSHLSEPDILENLPTYSVQVVCSLLELIVMTLVEARSCNDVRFLAKALKANNVPGAGKVCDLLLINQDNPRATDQSLNVGDNRAEVACWVSDQHPPGGRHDNDHTNFRDIRIVPTQAEINSQSPPWLPLASQENAFIENKEMRMLDANFRLLREDAVSSMRANVEEEKRVWNNARILGLNRGYGATGRGKVQPLSFLVQLSSSYVKKKDINWERSRALPHEGIIALCNPVDKSVQRLGTITTRAYKETGTWLNDPRGPIIGVSFHNAEDILSSLQEAVENMAILARTDSEADVEGSNVEPWNEVEKLFVSHDLIEASGSFFSYKPILSALQEFTSVPLAQELVYLNPSEQRPDYIPSQMSMPKASFNGFCCELDNWSTQKVVDSTSLDKSQADALHRALTSKVALIQGPPGTGKTFMGALIAQMIRENTDESILCVCYTNHALDQFLEHLYDNGETRIVRIGGRSQSEKLQKYNLKELARSKTKLSRDAKQRMSSVFAQLCKCQERLDQLSEKLKQKITWEEPNGGISGVLSYENPHFHQHFTAIEELPDGFEMVGKGNKKITGSSLFEQWAKGSNCPQFLKPYVELDPSLVEFWNLDKRTRGNMLDEWRALLLEDTQDSLKDAVLTFEELNAERQAINREQDLQILRDARVIGATTNGAAKYRDILSEKSPGVVIVEEAGEVLEPHIFSALSEQSSHSKETKHLILIGDHLQLRPKVECYELSAASQKGYNFDNSLFERLIKSHFPSTMLKVQHRMRPYISDFIRRQTYPALIDHPSVAAFKDVKGVALNVAFITHENPEKGGDTTHRESKTKSNAWEADMCVEMIRYLLLQGYRHDQITVLTPYVGQVIKILQVMRTRMKDTSAYVSELDRQEILDGVEEGGDIDLSSTEERKAIRCSSIDNFQGEESDIIVVSLVRSNANGIIGFLAEEQRVNVLLSRAKIGLYIVGNSTTLKRSAKGAHVWNPIIDTLKKDGALLAGFPTICQLHPKDAVVKITDHRRFRELCPNGGCTRPCTSRLECGHACPLACHPTDRSHLITHKQCLEPCRRIPPKCNLNHPCRKFCNQKCGECKTKVDSVVLLCGHELKIPLCYEVRDEDAILMRSKKCSEQIEHTFVACGHDSLTTCGNTQGASICPALCGKKMECDHFCHKSCKDCDGRHSCNVKCQRMLLCGHMCDNLCHGSSPCPPCENRCGNVCVHSKCEKKCSSNCSSCTHDCDWQCEHEGKCPVVCGAPCTRLPCQRRCKKKLSCGHQCPSVCGETCPSTEYCQDCCRQTRKSHIVDMIEFTTYEECDLNKDPIMLLPCGHFYTMSTLDGLFDMPQAYEIDSDGKYIGIKPLPRSQDVKPKCCPDCRTVVHSIGRYGRLLSFLRLRFLERKHLITVERSLKACAYKLNQGETKGKDLSNIIKKLQKVLASIKMGPTQKVFDACGGNTQVEVPCPPQKPIIQTLHLLGISYSRQVEESKDESYKKAYEVFTEVITICDETQSLRLGAEVRISLARLLLQWNDASKVKDDIASLIDPVLTNAVTSKFTELYEQAKDLKQQAATGTFKDVIQAMNMVDGYNYGGSWSSHWYECPNGHPYFIGNCGGATSTARCIECGESVGGSSHQLLASNRQSEAVRRVLNRS